MLFVPHSNVLKLSIKSGCPSIKARIPPSNLESMEAQNRLKFRVSKILLKMEVALSLNLSPKLE